MPLLPSSAEAREVRPSDVTFLFKLKESKYSVVFKVAVHGVPCVMKVDPKYREVNLFICESTVYQRLQTKGFCKQGVIPDFYGTITKIQPSLWPDLHMFLDDKLPPNTILIEYIQNLQCIDLSNYSKHRLDEIRRILYGIHNKARVYHGDARLRNMMVSPGESMGIPDRVLWVDFDSAQTLPEDEPLSKRLETWIRREVNIMEYFVDAMARDYEEGRLNLAYSYYYDCFFDGVPKEDVQCVLH